MDDGSSCRQTVIAMANPSKKPPPPRVPPPQHLLDARDAGARRAMAAAAAKRMTAHLVSNLMHVLDLWKQVAGHGYDCR